MKSRREIRVYTSSTVRGLAFAVVLAIVLALACSVASTLATAQEPDVLTPDQSSAKAQNILQQAIGGLGGPAYLNVKDITLEAHFSQFDHSGESRGTVKILDIAIPPDKDRTENLPKRNIIEVRDGSKGWSLDRGGVSEATVTDIAATQEDTA